jgi:prepilin peptidase CpaA
VKHISIKVACLVCLLFLAMRHDLISYKISNHIIQFGIFLGLIFNLYEIGWTGIIAWCCGIIIPIFILFPLFLSKTLGAGDIKLFSVIGSFYGIFFVLKSIWIAFVIAAVLSIFHLIKYKQVFCRLQYLVNYLRQILQKKNTNGHEIITLVKSPYYDVKKEGYKGVIHFSIAIFMAILTQVLFLI